jgi:hypothetical protein
VPVLGLFTTYVELNTKRVLKSIPGATQHNRMVIAKLASFELDIDLSACLWSSKYLNSEASF